MSKSEQQIEQEIQAKGLNAPRLTPESIDSKIKHAEYILPRDVCKRDNGVETFDAPVALQTLTFCILTLENGFTVTGESACASPENFNEEIGKKIAHDNAREKIWQLEGYLLKQRLYEQSLLVTPMQRMLAEQDVLAGNLGRLGEFLNKPKPDFISDTHWELMKQQHEHMFKYHDTLVHRIADLQEQAAT